MSKINKSLIFLGVSALAVFSLLAINEFKTPQAKGYSTNDFKTEAAKYAQDAETAGAPVALRHEGKYYYYVPFEINKTIPTFPGIMIDGQNKPVTDKTVLKELYRYPGLVKEFSDNVSKFDKLAAKKIPAFAQYCRILEVQKIKFDEVNMQANVVGVIYYGIKLAADAVSLAKTSVSGLAALAKDLAKSAVQDKILSYLVPQDSREILSIGQKAFDASRNSHEACKAALEAWNSVVSTSGKANTQYAKQATEEVHKMFYYESFAMTSLRTAFDRINNYPKIITKITKKKFKSGMDGLDKLIVALDKEKSTWDQSAKDANDENNLEMWADEQIDRIDAATPEEPVSPPPPAPPSACTNVNLAEDYKIYTYTPDNPGTNGPCRAFGNSATADKVTLTCTTDNRFRNHWVKKISVAGLNKVKIKADLTINDRGFFRSECPAGGVKYDNYSGLSVLSADPSPTFDAECNKICTPEDWPKCGIKPDDPSVIGKCGVAKCTSSKVCEFEVNTAGLNDIYLIFHTANPWPAYVTGTAGNIQVCPAQ